MDKQLKMLLRQTVTIRRRAGLDKYGQPVYAAGIEVPARIVRNPQLIRDTSGQEVVSNTQVWLDGDVEVSVADRLILPTGESVTIISITKIPDERGKDYATRVYT